MTAQPSVIRVEHLEKSYKDLHVLRGVDFDADIWFALAWCVSILVVAYVIAMIVYRRKIA